MKLHILGLLLASLLLLGCQVAEPPHEFAGAELADQQTVPNVVLQGADGPVTLDQFEGKYLFLYFGYTYCPHVCPLTLTQLALVQRELGEADEQMQGEMVLVTLEFANADTIEVEAEAIDVGTMMEQGDMKHVTLQHEDDES
ncbi:MAG: SCO family protein [Chloroflexota bacterium]